MVAFCTEFEVRDGGGGGVRRARSVRHRGSVSNMLQTWQSDLKPGQSHWERKVRNKDEKEEGKMRVNYGGTRTHDLANGLPCSNQLSYRITQLLSDWVQVLKAELPGIQLKQIPRWHVWWGGSYAQFLTYSRPDSQKWWVSYRIWSEGRRCGKQEAWGTEAQFLTCSRPDSQTLNLVKVIERERWEIKTWNRKKNDNDSWRDSNPQMCFCTGFEVKVGGGGGTVAYKTRLCSLFSKHRLIRCLRSGLPRNVLHFTFSLRFVLKPKIYIVAKILI